MTSNCKKRKSAIDANEKRLKALKERVSLTKQRENTIKAAFQSIVSD